VAVVDPCSRDLNPQCLVTRCDDGDPKTLEDACIWLTLPLGIDACKCVGKPAAFDPCADWFNPACKPEDCKTADGKAGRCGWNFDGCGCTGV
jgi:hypothetical protein